MFETKKRTFFYQLEISNINNCIYALAWIGKFLIFITYTKTNHLGLLQLLQHFIATQIFSRKCKTEFSWIFLLKSNYWSTQSVQKCRNVLEWEDLKNVPHSWEISRTEPKRNLTIEFKTVYALNFDNDDKWNTFNTS